MDGNKFLILPTILSMVSNQGINDMMIELEEFNSTINGDYYESPENLEDEA